MFVIVDRKTDKLIERADTLKRAWERQRELGVDEVGVKLAADWKGRS